jgi:hypothetical protein
MSTKVNDNGSVCLKVRGLEDTSNILQITPYLGTESIDHLHYAKKAGWVQ